MRLEAQRAAGALVMRDDRRSVSTTIAREEHNREEEFELGEKAPDADLVVTVAPAWGALVRLLRSNPRALFEIDARRLEEIIAGSYEASGYQNVIPTHRSG